MSESAMWRVLAKKLQGTVHARRIENSLATGTPDVAWTADGHSGFIELKHLPAWPAREQTIVKPKHFTDDQRQWLHDWRKAGGRADVLLRVGAGHKAVWLLIDGLVAASHLGRTLWRNDLILAAVCNLGNSNLVTLKEHLCRPLT